MQEFEGNLAVGAQVVERPLDISLDQEYDQALQTVAREEKYRGEIYGLNLALEIGLRCRELEDYIELQETTHIKEGIELGQRDSTDFKFENAHVIDSHTKRPMRLVAHDGHEAQKAAFKNKQGFEFMVARTGIDVEIADDNDRRMATSVVGATWMRITPYAEEESEDDVSKAGFWSGPRRAYVWIYRKKDEQTLEATVLSIDRSDVTAFAALAHDFGVDVPSNTTSHQMPSHVLEAPGLICNDEERDKLLDFIASRYRELADVVEASGLDMLSGEFIERFAQDEIISLKRLQQEIIYSLQAKKITPYVVSAGITSLETLGHDYLTPEEIHLIMRAINTKRPIDEVDGLELIMKAQRYGAWARIGEKLKIVKGLSRTEIEETVSKRMIPQSQEFNYLYQQQQTAYELGQKPDVKEQQQLIANGRAGRAAAERGDVKPGCPGGSSFLSQTESEAKKSLFGGKENDSKRWMSCPFCKKKDAVKARVCDKDLKCRHCEAEVKNGKVVNTGNGPDKADSNVRRTDVKDEQKETMTGDDVNGLRARLQDDSANNDASTKPSQVQINAA